MNQIPLLQMQHIRKVFPGVVALDDVSLTVKAGTVHALMGENGAGKSTLMKILTGVYTKTEGSILWQGKELDTSSITNVLTRSWLRIPGSCLRSWILRGSIPGSPWSTCPMPKCRWWR